MVVLFENPRAGDVESHLANLEYRTRADAERVVASMENGLNARMADTGSRQKSLKTPKLGCF
jgi:hypothetical protein